MVCAGSESVETDPDPAPPRVAAMSGAELANAGPPAPYGDRAGLVLGVLRGEGEAAGGVGVEAGGGSDVGGCCCLRVQAGPLCGESGGVAILAGSGAQQACASGAMRLAR